MLKRNTLDKSQKKKKKGQSTVEYIILVAAVIAVLLIFLSGPFKTVFQNTLETGSNGMINMATKLSNSRPSQ